MSRGYIVLEGGDNIFVVNIRLSRTQSKSGGMTSKTAMQEFAFKSMKNIEKSEVHILPLML